MDTDNDRPTLARVYRSLRDICPDSWNLPGGRMPTGLGYDFLRPVEDSGINDLKHYYFMADLADGQPLGRANLYSVCFDLATTDRKLTPAWRTTIKRWFPGFMTFRFLECGLLTMVSNPLALRSDTDLERVLPVLAGQMDQLAHDDGSDFLMIRDVDPEHYQRYLDILRPLGFRPALGFSRVDTTISWSSVEEALGCLSHKRRLPLKTSLEFRERFGIEVEELDEYAEHAPVLARLWRNVKTEAKDYQREDLNPEFIYFLRHSTDPVHTATLARMMMHNIQRPTLPDDMSEEFCRWEERIRLDQDGLPEHDIFRKIDRQHKYTGLKLGGVYGFYPRFTGPQRSTVKAAELGEIVLLGTNSYLGLATHPEVVEASAEATRRYGTGCSGSPLLNGTLDLHVSLEQELACFLGKPAAVLCSTGYQSNLAAISALCESGDMIIQDALNHRSLFDAARLSGADFTLYRHNDMDHLARVLRRTEGRRRIIVVDAVFSMEGTVADLATIAELADRHGCRVYVDESHALGVLGPDGRGASAALGVLARMDVVMGTFSKSFASVGGFIAGDRPVVDYIRHNGSGHVFSASLPPAAAAATHAALRVSRREPDRRARVLAAAEYMATGLARQGYQAEYHGTAIVPVILGNPTVAHAGYLRLMRSGVYVNPVAPPAVPEERSGFRTSYLADHRQSDLDRALHVFAGLAEDLTPQGAAL